MFWHVLYIVLQCYDIFSVAHDKCKRINVFDVWLDIFILVKFKEELVCFG